MDLVRSSVKWFPGSATLRGYGPAMPGRRGLTGKPRDFVSAEDRHRWLEVTLPDAPVEVRAVQALAQRLVAAMDGRSARSVAADADLQHTTLLGLLRGERWPDMATIVKLEVALDAALWPGRHV